MKNLKDKVAVITGGANGIGLSMAESFGREGMKLVIADIEEAALAGAIAKLTEKGFTAIGVRTDVSKFSEVERLAEATLKAFGKVHVVVNNAGVSITGPMWEMTLDDWRWVHDVNFWAVVYGIKVFTPIQLQQREEGHVIITASEASFLGIGHHSPYCSSKAAVLSVGLCLYSELAAMESSVGVSVVCPGMVDTQIHRAWRNRPAGDRPWSEREKDPEVQARSGAIQAAGARPEEIAELTLAALKENRFYVFNSPHWQAMLTAMHDVRMSGRNPLVHTWGPDLRGTVKPPQGS